MYSVCKFLPGRLKYYNSRERSVELLDNDVDSTDTYKNINV